MKRVLAILLAFQTMLSAGVLELDIITYDQFVSRDEEALKQLKSALLEKGIVGIKGIPGYREKVNAYIEAAGHFFQLPEEVKEKYAPNREAGDLFLGYEKGKEKFKRADGEWVVDDLKVSYYAFVPDNESNKWPTEVELKTAYEELGMLMSDTAVQVMQQIDLIGPSTLDGIPRVGRMLYYRKSVEGRSDNPLWCGAHFDHGLFTALIPAVYFEEGKQVDEPADAGLFVKPTNGTEFEKVVANDPDVMLFQVGEFGQLVTNDAIKATEHRVQRPLAGSIERYCMALFFDVSMDMVVDSTS
ncbi:MAG: isopenicillin N synthase family oxygenase, partial [Verrucomicrobia bacterium]|nr:isopenicillin N synthase family oxygenase [Verrucomicrobiota bacterium]